MNQITESKVKMLCPHCKEVYEVDIGLLTDWLELYMRYGLIFVGVWCDECRTAKGPVGEGELGGGMNDTVR